MAPPLIEWANQPCSTTRNTSVGRACRVEFIRPAVFQCDLSIGCKGCWPNEFGPTTGICQECTLNRFGNNGGKIIESLYADEIALFGYSF